MPRPPQSEQARHKIRTRILEAARGLITEDGIKAVSLRAIGARVGLTAAALYAYFPNKLALVRAIWEDALRELEQRIEATSSACEDPMDAIRAVAMTYARFGFENPERFRILFLIDMGSLGNELASATENHAAYLVVVERVEEATRRGQIVRVRDPHLASQVLWASIHGVVALTTEGDGFPFQPAETLAQAAIESILAGLTQAEPTHD